MKKFFRLLLLSLCLTVFLTGAVAEPLRGYEPKQGYVYVTLGRYPQTVDGGTPGDPAAAWKWKGSVIEDPSGLELTPEPILWRVLAADDEQIWIQSEYILLAMPIHTDYTEYKRFKGDFTQTELWSFLNGQFLAEAFTSEEAEMFLPADGDGKLFILSSDDLKNKALGFTGNAARKAWATEYAVRVTGAFVYKQAEKCCSPYWTSTPSTSGQAAGRAARCTKQDGSVGYYNTSNPEEGVRPSGRLKAGSFTVTAGTGTPDDPLVLTSVVTPVPAVPAE